ncbi:hypothetical protein L7F22_019923 [Adiantum nelumboides]|nr:hypothetical protein [Adiantum nelumboides]
MVAKTLKVAIVGGGPSGLVTLKTLLDLADRHSDIQVEASLFEAEDAIGGTFRYRSYQNAQLVSSKQLTAFSDFRLPLNAPDHLSLNKYVEYLQDYVNHFKLQQRAHRFLLNTRVVHICRTSASDSIKNGHVVTWQTADGKQHTDTFTHLSLCSGLHVTPSYPEIPGVPPLTKTPIEELKQKQDEKATKEEVKTQGALLSESQGRIVALHSSSYKSPEIYKNKRVLILGTGETGMDMGYEAVKARAKEIVMCTREGTEAGCNQWVGELPPERLGRAYTFLNKSNKAIPYINRSWKKRHWALEKFARYLDPPTVSADEPGIDLAPFPSHILPSGEVVFRRNNRKESKRMGNRHFKPDVIVFATGYTQEFPFLDDSNGAYPVPADAHCRDVFAYDDPSVSFIGFTRPGVGAIPPQAEMCAQLWSLVIAGKLEAPKDVGHYYLLARPQARIKYGVDYSSYVSQLARDMGSAPSLWDLWREYGILVLFIYCFSASFPTHYRLVGPWRDSSAVEIEKTEILETITRRGFGGNMMMGVIPMAFYAVVNVIAYIVEATLHVAEYLFPTTCKRVANAVGLHGQKAYNSKSTKTAKLMQ